MSDTNLLLPELVDRAALVAWARQDNRRPCAEGVAWALAGCPADDPGAAGYVSWIVECLPAAAFAAYEAVQQPALAAYRAVEQPAYDAYRAAERPALAAYEAARASAAIAAALGRLS